MINSDTTGKACKCKQTTKKIEPEQYTNYAHCTHFCVFFLYLVRCALCYIAEIHQTDNNSAIRSNFFTVLHVIFYTIVVEAIHPNTGRRKKQHTESLRLAERCI